jgi:E3 ubiquitin-protein ligase RNF25
VEEGKKIRRRLKAMAAQAQAEAEEEVRLELEAMAAVYGDDVRVLRDLPPHLVVDVRPRTADDSSQQVRLAPSPSPATSPLPLRPSLFPSPSR